MLESEDGNQHDQNAVTVVKDGYIVRPRAPFDLQSILVFIETCWQDNSPFWTPLNVTFGCQVISLDLTSQVLDSERQPSLLP